MNPALLADPLIRQLHQLVAELTLISHISAIDYDSKTARSSDDDIGGRRPTGGDQDRPKRPSENADSRTVAEYRDDYDAWLSSYQRRTPDYFRRELEECQTVSRLRSLVEEARDTLEAWRRMPAPRDRPASMADPQWKRWVAFGGATAADVCRWYGCSRQYVSAIRRGYREDAA